MIRLKLKYHNNLSIVGQIMEQIMLIVLLSYQVQICLEVRIIFMDDESMIGPTRTIYGIPVNNMYLVDEQICSIIVKKNKYINATNLLWCVTDRNYPYFAKVLLRIRKDIDINAHQYGITPLMLACHWSETAMVRLFLRQPSININLIATKDSKEHNGKTAFDIAKMSQASSKLVGYFQTFMAEKEKKQNNNDSLTNKTSKTQHNVKKTHTNNVK